MRDALLAGRCQSPEHRAADQHPACSQRQRLERVGATAHAAVEQHLGAAVDRSYDFLERVERTGHAVELATAVIRHDDCSSAVLARKPRVLGGEDPLDDDRQAVAGEPLEVAPAESRVEAPAEDVARDGEVLRNLEVNPDVALSPAEKRRVDGEHQRRELARDRLGDQILGLRAVGEDVDLEPVPAGRSRRGDLGGPNGCGRRETHDRSGRSRRARGCELAVGMRHALQCNRRDQNRQSNVVAEDRRRSRHGGDIDEHARSQLASLESCNVVPQRDLVPGPAGEVRVRVRVELLLGELLVVPDVDRVAHVATLNVLGHKPAAARRRDRAPAAAHAARGVAEPKKKGARGGNMVSPAFPPR